MQNFRNENSYQLLTRQFLLQELPIEKIIIEIFKKIAVPIIIIIVVIIIIY